MKKLVLVLMLVGQSCTAHGCYYNPAQSGGILEEGAVALKCASIPIQCFIQRHPDVTKAVVAGTAVTCVAALIGSIAIGIYQRHTTHQKSKFVYSKIEELQNGINQGEQQETLRVRMDTLKDALHDLSCQVDPWGVRWVSKK